MVKKGVSSDLYSHITIILNNIILFINHGNIIWDTYFPIQMAYDAGSRGKNKIERAVSTSTAPKQSGSRTPKVQWK